MSPYDLLQVDASADDATIREAYLAAVRRFPPTADPDRFNRIARAYEQVSTAEKRIAYELFEIPETVPGGPLAQVLDYLRIRRPRPNHASLCKSLREQI